jgi:hypothetical protein
VRFDKVVISARLNPQSSEVTLRVTNTSSETIDFKLGGCGVRLLAYRGANTTPAFDSLTGGCDLDLASYRIDPTASVSISQIVAGPGQLSALAADEEFVFVILLKPFSYQEQRLRPTVSQPSA